MFARSKMAAATASTLRFVNKVAGAVPADMLLS